ncbi:MAG: pyridoxamine 5'-phosphate oxidase family protein [Planctomycetota bacterium]|jgi:hypothetical protein|nr:pyridoxamine 5'-phosphate oxidase family protein [Planctomycetota bacterium]MDP7253110.1 pyridoxamine 5'-phosphate oxidase family protein [Planctomycetota bacterium]
MRRSEKEIKDRSLIDSIIRSCQVCRLGLCDGREPYVVPLSFGYDGQALYLHAASEGRKLDILQENSRVCIEFDIVHEVVEAEDACSWGIKYQSVIGFGTAEIVEEMEEKRRGLALLMSQYSDKEFSFPDAAVQRTCVMKVTIDSITGKQSVD